MWQTQLPPWAGMGLSWGWGRECTLLPNGGKGGGPVKMQLKI